MVIVINKDNRLWLMFEHITISPCTCPCICHNRMEFCIGYHVYKGSRNNASFTRWPNKIVRWQPSGIRHAINKNGPFALVVFHCSAISKRKTQRSCKNRGLLPGTWCRIKCPCDYGLGMDCVRNLACSNVKGYVVHEGLDRIWLNLSPWGRAWSSLLYSWLVLPFVHGLYHKIYLHHKRFMSFT